MNKIRGFIAFAVCLSMLVLSVSAQIPTAGMVTKYLFSGNANDSSGNNSHGTVSGALLTSDRFGNANQAYKFDGTNDYIICDTPHGLPAGDAAKSISAWFKSGVISSSLDKMIAGFGTQVPAGGRSFSVGYYYGGWRVNGYGDSYDWKTGLTSPNYFDTLWHHCAVTYDGVSTKLYMDGSLKVTTTNFHYNTATERIIVGREINSGWWWNGSLDDIYFYNRALSETEVRALYAEKNYGISLVEITSTYNRRPVFKWHPNASATAYTIKIDTVSSLANSMIIFPTADTAYTPAIDLPFDTIYWRVSSDSGKYSPVSSFIVWDSRVPSPVPFVPNILSIRRPVFRWHPVATATTYTIAVDTTSRFINSVISTPVSDTFFSAQADLPADTIYWKVRSNLVAAYSETDWFIIQADSIPFLYRFNGEIVSSTRPDFRWKPVAGAATYRIEIDTVKTFIIPFVSVPLSDTLYKPGVQLQSRYYYWRVSSSKNNQLFSPVDSVIVREPVGILGRGSGIRLKPDGVRCLYCRVSGILTVVLPEAMKAGTLGIFDLSGRNLHHAVFTTVNGQTVKVNLNFQKNRNSILLVAVSDGEKNISRIVGTIE